MKLRKSRLFCASVLIGTFCATTTLSQSPRTDGTEERFRNIISTGRLIADPRPQEPRVVERRDDGDVIVEIDGVEMRAVTTERWRQILADRIELDRLKQEAAILLHKAEVERDRAERLRAALDAAESALSEARASLSKSGGRGLLRWLVGLIW